MNTGYSKKKTSGQAMAEFALALPILMLIIYGVIETGRALFIYASVNNASREAARFGSSDCNEPDCTPQYQKCAEIRDRARATGFLLDLQDDQIVIQYDDGLDASGDPTAVTDACNDPDGIDEAVVIDAGDRILVTVTAPYSMIIPILPFTFDQFSITSARTIPLILELDR